MLLNLILCLIGFFILSYAADKLVEGASNLALNYGVSKLVIGMTIVAAGTSLPEMVVSINAAFKGHPELALGNVVGSNIMNIALILGIAALIQPISCQRQTIYREVPIMIGSAIFLWFVAHTNQQITFNEGLIIFLMFFSYIYLSYYWSKEESESNINEDDKPPNSPTPTIAMNFAFIVGGLIGLTIGSELLVRSATAIAKGLGVSDEVIGLTLLAIGTSLPELATSVVAASKGHSEITLGNVIGSNIFNILGIVGCASLACRFNGIPGSDVLNVTNNMLGIHIPIMVAISMSVLPIMLNGLKIMRIEGVLLVCFYLLYNVVLIQSMEKTQLAYKDSQKTNSTQTQRVLPASTTVLIEKTKSSLATSTSVVTETH